MSTAGPVRRRALSIRPASAQSPDAPDHSLYYKNGFQNTGVREILEAADAHKASLYRHFENKDDLIRAYLAFRQNLLADFLNLLAARSPDAKHFFRFWQSGLVRQAREGELHGCPLANLNAELGQERERFRPDITAVGDHWLEILRSFLEREQRARRIKRRVDVEHASRRIMLVYEGHLQIYSLYGSAELPGNMAADMQALIE